MRNLTKASREASRAAQFEYLTQKGYNKETYKGLEIFTHPEELLLKVYNGTAANHSIFYKYRTEAQMLAKVQEVKNNYDRREQWKAEQKENNKGAKITLATLKSFLNKNENNIFIKVVSSFDGMTDCVERVEDEFTKVTRSESPKDYNLGFSGLYLVGQSRDTIRHFENDNFIGFDVYNSCGSCIVATPKKREKQTMAEQQTTAQSGKIQIVDYSEKAIAVIGETKQHKDKLKELGGSFNPRLSCGAGWIFSKKRLEDVKAYFLSLKTAEQDNNIQNKENAEFEQVNSPKSETIQQPAQLPTKANFDTPEDAPQIEYFRIIWHEGRQINGATFENATFENWEDVQKAFYILWQVNEQGQGGGYTKVKCEIKQPDKDTEIFRVDITDDNNSGDFNPSTEHIVSYISHF